jgi:hypothetical protein
MEHPILKMYVMPATVVQITTSGMALPREDKVIRMVRTAGPVMLISTDMLLTLPFQ